MKYNHQISIPVFPLIILFILCFCFPAVSFTQSKPDSSMSDNLKGLILKKGVTCEDINGYLPRNRAVVFSVEREKVYCVTSFDPVPGKTTIYHNWFFNDKLSIKKKLVVTPEKGTVFTCILLRYADKGVWRVEISDAKGNALKILRFSVTD